jgi:hypothetical protein
MRTSCVRPGCGGSAAAAVLIDRGQQVVVLQPPEVGGPGSIALCARHVARVTMTPAGWRLDDLRVMLVRDEPVVTEAVARRAPDPAPSPAPAVATTESSLLVDDGATPLLGRGVPGRVTGLRLRPGEAPGFAWLERRHGQVDGGPRSSSRTDEDHG